MNFLKRHPVLIRGSAILLSIGMGCATGKKVESKDEQTPSNNNPEETTASDKQSDIEEVSTVSDAGSIECDHPDVEESCDGNWCHIPPGCFLFGSEPEENCRAKSAEQQVYVTLTHGFVIYRTELTQADWEAVGFRNPSPEPQCPECPVSRINWYEGLAFCNSLSLSEGFEPCYDLSSCVGAIGNGCIDDTPECFVTDPFICSGDVYRFADIYECPGYRLPTTAEWEYATRAGTTTQTYLGDVLSDTIQDCEPDPVVDEIAWTCSNSEMELSSQAWPVALKKKNPWGLFDTIGNVEELVSDAWQNRPLGFDALHITDPHGFVDYSNSIPLRGCSWIKDPSCCRSGFTTADTKTSLRKYQGIRPVRTVLE